MPDSDFSVSPGRGIAIALATVVLLAVGASAIDCEPEEPRSCTEEVAYWTTREAYYRGMYEDAVACREYSWARGARRRWEAAKKELRVAEEVCGGALQ
jgi:hypothetical protein